MVLTHNWSIVSVVDLVKLGNASAVRLGASIDFTSQWGDGAESRCADSRPIDQVDDEMNVAFSIVSQSGPFDPSHLLPALHVRVLVFG
jgi:hypothetical protein